MAHVQISKSDDGFRVVVDGVDMSMAVTTDVVADHFEPEMGTAHVHLTVVADKLDIDLPDAVIAAVRGEA